MSLARAQRVARGEAQTRVAAMGCCTSVIVYVGEDIAVESARAPRQRPQRRRRRRRRRRRKHARHERPWKLRRKHSATDDGDGATSEEDGPTPDNAGSNRTGGSGTDAADHEPLPPPGDAFDESDRTRNRSQGSSRRRARRGTRSRDVNADEKSDQTRASAAGGEHRVGPASGDGVAVADAEDEAEHSERGEQGERRDNNDDSDPENGPENGEPDGDGGAGDNDEGGSSNDDNAGDAADGGDDENGSRGEDGGGGSQQGGSGSGDGAGNDEGGPSGNGGTPPAGGESGPADGAPPPPPQPPQSDVSEEGPTGSPGPAADAASADSEVQELHEVGFDPDGGVDTASTASSTSSVPSESSISASGSNHSAVTHSSASSSSSGSSFSSTQSWTWSTILSVDSDESEAGSDNNTPELRHLDELPRLLRGSAVHVLQRAVRFQQHSASIAPQELHKIEKMLASVLTRAETGGLTERLSFSQKSQANYSRGRMFADTRCSLYDLKVAIDMYDKALAALDASSDRFTDPVRFGCIQHDRAIALLSQRQDDLAVRRADTERARRGLHEALRHLPMDTEPRLWRRLNLVLAEAYISQSDNPSPAVDPRMSLHNAYRYTSAVCLVWTKREDPVEWAAAVHRMALVIQRYLDGPCRTPPKYAPDERRRRDAALARHVSHDALAWSKAVELLCAALKVRDIHPRHDAAGRYMSLWVTIAITLSRAYIGLARETASVSAARRAVDVLNQKVMRYLQCEVDVVLWSRVRFVLSDAEACVEAITAARASKPSSGDARE